VERGVNQAEHPFVSVIIPVFNDGERLRRCLLALGQQTYPRDRFEVVVVDNGSSEDVAAIVAGQAFVTLGHEARPGSYAARNTGLGLARGEVLAFTDSDCLPQPDWIAAGVARLAASPGCGLVAGKISVFFQDPQRPTATELYESLTAFQQHKYIERDHYGATANLFTRRDVFDVVGRFSDGLTSGGDREWGQGGLYQTPGAPQLRRARQQDRPGHRRYGEPASAPAGLVHILCQGRDQGSAAAAA
jgi:glycosyltransferase involved in cell wall biosynthesis